MEKRLHYFDFLRGIAIIGVIAIHATPVGYLVKDTEWGFNLTVVWRQLINFAVPMFIAISGYFLANKNTRGTHYFGFLKRQIPRVLIPYFVWSLLYLSISYNNGTSLKGLIFQLITFQSTGPFYFIILIVEYYLLLPLLQKLATQKGLILATLISFISCFFIFYTRYYLNLSLPLYLTASAPSWLVFFVLGIYIRKHVIQLKIKTLFLFVLIGLVLSIVETYFLYHKFGSIGDNVTAIKISAFIYSIFIVLLAFKLAEIFSSSRSKWFKYIVTLGELSFGIYLSHMFFLMVVEYLFGKFSPFLEYNVLINQIALVLCTLGFSSLLAILLRKANKEIAIKYLGQ